MDYLQINVKIITNNLSFNSESVEMIDQVPFCSKSSYFDSSKITVLKFVGCVEV